MITKKLEKIKYTKFGLFCGLCSSKVPFEKKYLTEYYQQKVQKESIWNVFISYICPKCNNVTKIVLTYNKSQIKSIKKINLYNTYK